jgi:hypothetical protein
VPDLFRDVVAGQRDQVKNDVNVPLIIGGILLGQDSHLQYHLLPDAVVCCLEIGEHLEHNVLRVGAVAHGVKEVDSALFHGDVR